MAESHQSARERPQRRSTAGQHSAQNDDPAGWWSASGMIVEAACFGTSKKKDGVALAWLGAAGSG
jgi:hypothetical protein